MKNIVAPWTVEQVDALNRWQHLGYVHEFTCPVEHEGDKTLLATRSSLICPHCMYRQEWAHDFMLDASQHPEPQTTITADVLKSLKLQHEVIDLLSAMLITQDINFFPSRQPWWPGFEKAHDIIKMLEGPNGK